MANKNNHKVTQSGQFEFEFEPQPSQVDGHHILDDIALQIVYESDDNELIINNNIIQNNDDNESICTFKSTVSNKSDPLHQFLFSMHQDQPATNKRKRSFQDMINDSDDNESIIDISQPYSIHSISSTQSTSYSDNSNKRQRRKEQDNIHDNPNKVNLEYRWDPHIFRGNTEICFRLKGIYHPAKIQSVTTNYFIVSTKPPHTLTAKCYRFKYKDYIKDKQRVISLVNASQLTQTQSQSQHNIVSLQQIHTPSSLQSDNNHTQHSGLNPYLSLSDDDPMDGNMNNESDSDKDTDNNKQNDNTSDDDNEYEQQYVQNKDIQENEDDDDDLSMNISSGDKEDEESEYSKYSTIGMRVKQRRMSQREQCVESESDITSPDESDQNYRCNHNVKQIGKKRKKKLKWKRVLSDDDEDSDCKKVYDDEGDTSRDKKVKKVKKRSRETRKGLKYIYWTSVETAAVIEGYKKYRKYENAPLFSAGVFSKIMGDKKYKKIFKKNKRTRRTVKHKWYRLNDKLELTQKWDKEAKRRKRRKVNRSNSKSEDDKTDSSECLSVE